jgi:hypothetical protein
MSPSSDLKLILCTAAFMYVDSIDPENTYFPPRGSIQCPRCGLQRTTDDTLGAGSTIEARVISRPKIRGRFNGWNERGSDYYGR